MSARVACAVAVLLAATPARADRPDLRVDVEPAAYLLRGFSAHLRMALPPAPRNVLGIGAYGFDLPALLVELASANRDEPWDVRLLLGYHVFVDRFIGASPRDGWLIGAQLGVQHYRARLGADEARFANLLVLLRAGYEWHPQRRGFYLFPWLGLGGTVTIAGDTRAGADDYDVLPAVPYGAVELGYRW